MPMYFDHFAYAARDLDALSAHFEGLTGVTPRAGGRHPGLGTRNALAGLSPQVYLELMATDPTQALVGNMGEKVYALTEPRLLFYMLTGRPLEQVRDALQAHGIGCHLFDASRQTPDGGTLRWRLLLAHDNPYGMLIPNAIDWLDSVHPASFAVPGCTFDSFEIGHPQPDKLNAVLADLHAGFSAQRADRAYMRLRILTPQGPLLLLN